uniref:cDNA clone:J013118P06, full insert sequence n=1 Tax=Oryza sativa subsp. japonica TaxID=39947 RepID=B7EE20_ORYSJ|nr:unnamed protein product [Oryza sativa Japonica Group]
MGTQQAGEGSKSSAHVLYLLPATNKSQTMDSKKVAYAVFIVILLMTEVAAAAAAGGSARGTGGTGHIKECVNHVENQCGWAPAPGCLKEALATCAK